MRSALAVLAGCVFLLGCSKRAAPAVAVATPPPPAAPDIRLKAAPFVNGFVPTDSATNTVIQWEAILAQFKVDDAERHGIAEIFKSAGQKNSVVETELASSPLVEIGRGSTNVMLQLASAAYAVRCTFEESTNLIQYMRGAYGIDLLSQPRMTTRGTNSGLLQISNSITVVLGGANKTDSSAILATNISVGPTVSLRLVGRTNEGIVVEASARLEEFHGYNNEKKDRGRPVFVVTALGTRAQLATNEVLLLGGPIQMNVVQTVDRVPYLSDVPAVGRLFTKTHHYTNFVRTIVIVRPRIQ